MLILIHKKANKRFVLLSAVYVFFESYKIEGFSFKIEANIYILFYFDSTKNKKKINSPLILFLQFLKVAESCQNCKYCKNLCDLLFQNFLCQETNLHKTRVEL